MRFYICPQWPLLTPLPTAVLCISCTADLLCALLVLFQFWFLSITCNKSKHMLKKWGAKNVEKNARHRGAENVKNARHRGTGACATSLLVFVTWVAELTSLLLPLLSTMHQHYIATLLITTIYTLHYITLLHCSTNKQYIHWKTAFCYITLH